MPRFGNKTTPRNLAMAIRARIEPLGGVDLELPPREPMREPPDFHRRSGSGRDDRRGPEPPPRPGSTGDR